MSPKLKRSRMRRWAAPVGAVALVAAVLGGGPVIAAVTANDALPPKDAEELLKDAQKAWRSGKLPPMSGTVVQSADLGLPELPSQGNDSDPINMLSGSHTVRVWYGDEEHVRVALQGNGTEHNLIRNGDEAWRYDSRENTATKYNLPKGDSPKGAKPPQQPPLPRDAAEEALGRVDEHTKITVDETAEVAGRDAYEVTLRPQGKGSLIGSVRLALDGENYMPLRVQVFAKGADNPAAQVGFTKVTYTQPAAENFDFTPPEGAKVEETTVNRRDHRPEDMDKAHKASEDVKKIGEGWTTVMSYPMPEGGLDRAGENAIGDALLQAAKKTDQGRLLETTLATALLTDDGLLYVGAVEPEVLTEAAKRG